MAATSEAIHGGLGHVLKRENQRDVQIKRHTHQFAAHRPGQCGGPSNFGIELKSLTHACCERTNICRRGTKLFFFPPHPNPPLKTFFAPAPKKIFVSPPAQYFHSPPLTQPPSQ